MSGSFENLGLNQSIVSSVKNLGFENPTEIQQKVIPHLLNNEGDIIALAQTGTGKTAAFGLPIIQKIDPSKRHTQALILCPTRELCIQLEKDLSSYKSNNREIKTLAIYGGAAVGPQKKALRGNIHIVVGTPGRTLDFIKHRALVLDKLDVLVLDEADEMLNMGFKEDLDEILSSTSTEKQVLLFSATMPKEIRRIAGDYMNNPMEILAGGKRNIGSEHVSHYYSVSSYKLKFEVLQRIMSMEDDVYGLVFCRTRKDTSDLSHKLTRAGFQNQFIHGELSQSQRESVLNSFRKKKIKLLIATDVAARGLDVNLLTHVINYNLPDDLEVYIHRSGRTGRAGNKGKCISILNTREVKKIQRLERILGKKLEKLTLPSSEELARQKLIKHIEKVINRTSDNRHIEKILPDLMPAFDGMSKNEIISCFVKDAFHFLNLSHSFELDSQMTSSSKPAKTEDVNFKGLFLAVGKKKGINPGFILSLVNENSGKGKAAVGRIEINKNYTLFEVEDRYVDHILKHFNRKKVEGTNVFLKEVELSEFSDKPKRESRGKHRGKKRGYPKKGKESRGRKRR